MREIRTSGSEGGGPGTQPALPTPIGIPDLWPGRTVESVLSQVSRIHVEHWHQDGPTGRDSSARGTALGWGQSNKGPCGLKGRDPR
jgi:hypothetical protein